MAVWTLENHRQSWDTCFRTEIFFGSDIATHTHNEINAHTRTHTHTHIYININIYIFTSHIFLFLSLSGPLWGPDPQKLLCTNAKLCLCPSLGGLSHVQRRGSKLRSASALGAALWNCLGHAWNGTRSKTDSIQQTVVVWVIETQNLEPVSTFEGWKQKGRHCAARVSLHPKVSTTSCPRGCEAAGTLTCTCTMSAGATLE